jgi:hypothetical protein
MRFENNKGNNPELWNQLLTLLDDKLQLGLLDRLSRVASYHFEDQTLFIVPGLQSDHEYLAREAVQQQLSIYCKEATKHKRVALQQAVQES